MARLPDATSLGVSTPRPTRAIASYDGGIGARGQIQAGQQIQQFGAEVDKIAEKRQSDLDKTEVAMAALEYRKQIDAGYQKLSENPDGYETYEQDFSSLEAQARSSALARVSNKDRHADVGIALQEMSLPYQSKMRDMRNAVFSDKTIAYVANDLEDEKRAQMANPDPSRIGQKQMLWKNTLAGLVHTGKSQTEVESMMRKLDDDAQASYWDALGKRDGYSETYKKLSDTSSVVSGSSFDELLPVIHGAEIDPKNPDKISSDGDGTKVYRGINSGANKAVFSQIEGLLAEGKNQEARALADSVYKKKYWDDVGIDSLPANVRAIVFDASVNQGEGYAKQLVEKARAGATPAELIQMRRERYANTKGTPNEKASWENRLRSLEKLPFIPSPDVTAQKMNQFRAFALEDVKQKAASMVAAAGDGIEPAPLSQADMDMLTPIQREALALDLSVAKKSFQIMDQTPSEAQASVEALKPTADPSSKEYAFQSEAYEKIQAEAIKIANARQEKPVESAIKANASIRALAEYTGDDPVIKQAYFSELHDWQKRMGVAEKKYLTDTQAQQQAAFISQEFGTRTDRLSIIADSKNKYGKFWPEIYKQISPKLSGGIIAAMEFADLNPKLATTFANTFDQTDEQLTQNMTDGAYKSFDKVKEKIKEEMKDLSDTIPSGVVSDALETQVTRAALHYIKQERLSTENAIKMAVDEVNSSYKTIPTNQGARFRVPATVDIDADKLERSAREYIRFIPESKLKVDYTQLDPFYPRTPEAFKDAVSHGAYWVTRPDDSGVVLVLNGAAVLDNSGKKIEKTWDDLRRYVPYNEVVGRAQQQIRKNSEIISEIEKQKKDKNK